LLHTTTGLSSEQREDVLLGVIVHTKALGSSGRSRHHHRHKRTHHTRDTHDHVQHQQQQHKKLKMEVGIGSVTPPSSPKKPSSSYTLTLEDNAVPSTSITHFSAGLNSVGLNSEGVSSDVKETDNNVVSDDEAYSPSDNVVEKSITSNPEASTAVTSTLTATDNAITPALSPNTMSKLQSLIETVKESIAAMPSSVKQEEPSASEELPPLPTTKEEEKDDSTTSAYVFHETLPPNVNVSVTTVTMTQTTVNQQPVSSFYGNPDVHPHKTVHGSSDSSQFVYQEPGRRWPPYKGKWSPNGR